MGFGVFGGLGFLGVWCFWGLLGFGVLGVLGFWGFGVLGVLVHPSCYASPTQKEKTKNALGLVMGTSSFRAPSNPSGFRKKGRNPKLPQPGRPKKTLLPFRYLNLGFRV